MHGLVVGNLEIVVEEPAANRIVLRWNGASNSPAECNGLRPFFALALADASSKRARVEMHFEKLTHFNSSTIAEVMRFINDARTRAVCLWLFYDGSLRWQAHNFEAIAALAGPDGLLDVHNVGSGLPSEEGGGA
jgi:hypothetical protein